MELTLSHKYALQVLNGSISEHLKEIQQRQQIVQNLAADREKVNREIEAHCGLPEGALTSTHEIGADGEVTERARPAEEALRAMARTLHPGHPPKADLPTNADSSLTHRVEPEAA